MLAPQRRAAIVDEVRRRGGVRVSELASSFGVSDMTIRRDVDVLVAHGLIARVHGGVLAVETAADEPAYSVKATRQEAEKAAIARAAAQLVAPGSAVGISAGSTTAALARLLTTVPGLTVVTNSVAVSDVFHRDQRPDRTVLLTGGVRTPSDALVGPAATAVVSRLNVDLLFLGVHGMSARAGYTTPNLAEAETNRALAAMARTVVVLADHTKWDLVGIATIMPLDGADVVVTDTGLTDDARTELRSRVDEVILADPGSGPGGGAGSGPGGNAGSAAGTAAGPPADPTVRP
ncbi:DeoR/GlpR family DNA-binding transcription regulator [Micromonospora echinofusca]|uniref:DeoR family transcriptional regulator n=1 Tax=Micromonospora echinofusca TaxID=47858 RepID=A0ABS3VNQ1_MICEH|nr:DeoR/GlpR family DNA-binding transcription regulator [Micromonospora echinofusca]MBO4206127.1 DeoR family transcriptional regulator [Micromonospora echinofusca]